MWNRVDDHGSNREGIVGSAWQVQILLINERVLPFFILGC
jgi:hypothetical protein